MVKIHHSPIPPLETVLMLRVVVVVGKLTTLNFDKEGLVVLVGVVHSSIGATE
jgi:hypothetical protein